ncbi:MAG: LysE family transporter [Candidatus Ranarchaeia archaeon]
MNYQKGITLGIITSIANPYFLIWWLSIGWVYMNNLFSYLPFEGINILTSATLIFVFHIAADIIWYNIVIIGINKGMKFLNNNFYKKIILLSSMFLLFLGLRFIIQGFLLI